MGNTQHKKTSIRGTPLDTNNIRTVLYVLKQNQIYHGTEYGRYDYGKKLVRHYTNYKLGLGSVMVDHGWKDITLHFIDGWMDEYSLFGEA